jgi:hypothetical protein
MKIGIAWLMNTITFTLANHKKDYLEKDYGEYWFTLLSLIQKILIDILINRQILKIYKFTTSSIPKLVV